MGIEGEVECRIKDSLLVLLFLSGVNETRREDGHTMARGMGSPASLPVGVSINAGAEADLDGDILDL